MGNVESIIVESDDSDDEDDVMFSMGDTSSPERRKRKSKKKAEAARMLQAQLEEEIAASQLEDGNLLRDGSEGEMDERSEGRSEGQGIRASKLVRGKSPEFGMLYFGGAEETPEKSGPAHADAYADDDGDDAGAGTQRKGSYEELDDAMAGTSGPYQYEAEAELAAADNPYSLSVQAHSSPLAGTRSAPHGSSRGSDRPRSTRPEATALAAPGESAQGRAKETGDKGGQGVSQSILSSAAGEDPHAEHMGITSEKPRSSEPETSAGSGVKPAASTGVDKWSRASSQSGGRETPRESPPLSPTSVAPAEAARKLQPTQIDPGLTYGTLLGVYAGKGRGRAPEGSRKSSSDLQSMAVNQPVASSSKSDTHSRPTSPGAMLKTQAARLAAPAQGGNYQEGAGQLSSFKRATSGGPSAAVAWDTGNAASAAAGAVVAATAASAAANTRMTSRTAVVVDVPPPGAPPFRPGTRVWSLASTPVSSGSQGWEGEREGGGARERGSCTRETLTHYLA